VIAFNSRGLPDIVAHPTGAGARCSRQNMRKRMLSHADTFPPPVHGGSTLIWHLDDVLDWLSARGRYPVAQTTLETARLLRQLNLARETLYLRPEVVKTLDAYLA